MVDRVATVRKLGPVLGAMPTELRMPTGRRLDGTHDIPHRVSAWFHYGFLRDVTGSWFFNTELASVGLAGLTLSGDFIRR